MTGIIEGKKGEHPNERLDRDVPYKIILIKVTGTIEKFRIEREQLVMLSPSHSLKLPIFLSQKQKSEKEPNKVTGKYDPLFKGDLNICDKAETILGNPRHLNRL